MLRYRFINTLKLMDPSVVTTGDSEWLTHIMTKDISTRMNNAKQRMHQDMHNWILPDSLKGLKERSFNYTEHSLFATALKVMLNFSDSDVGFGSYSDTIESIRLQVEGKQVKLRCTDSELAQKVKMAVIENGGDFKSVDRAEASDWWLE